MRTFLATATTSILAAAAVLLPALPAHADRDDGRDRYYNDRDYRDRDDRWRDDHRSRYYWPWYRRGPSTTVVVRPSPRYYRSIEADVQRALARRGYYRGPIDGDIGPSSRAAIRTYQYRQGLPATGRIDRYLLRSLGL